MPISGTWEEKNVSDSGVTKENCAESLSFFDTNM